MKFWRRRQESETEGTPSTVDEGAVAAVAEEPEGGALAAELIEVVEQTDRAVERSRRGLLGRLGGLFTRTEFGDELWDELEEILIGADAGLPTTAAILDAVRTAAKAGRVRTAEEVRGLLRDELVRVLEAPAASPPAWDADSPPVPLVVVVVGVNGAGKTTSIGKLAHQFRSHGATVVLGAADTFRAAASDQLKVWGQRAGARVIAHKPGADPGAVAFDALEAGAAGGAEVVIIDTAGRLHTKTNLMEELKKVMRVIERRTPGAPHETLLVLDATTGQNGLSQAKVFTGAVGVTGIVLAKLDGTARGGIVFAIAHDLGLPVRFIGTGERIGDLAQFDAATFVNALLEP
jgi:fused signal recognition particle receptor